MRIAILTPMLTDTQPYWLSIIKFQTYCHENNIEVCLITNKMSHIAYARDNLIKQLENSGFDYDYVLWVDADQSFEPEQVMKLIANDKPVCCGLIKMLDGKQFAVGWIRNGTSAVYMHEAFLQEYTDNKVDNPQEIDFLGFGFTLIKREVMDALDGNPFQNDGSRSRMIPEDMCFFFKVKDAGFKMYVDRTVRIAHWKLLPMI